VALALNANIFLRGAQVELVVANCFLIGAVVSWGGATLILISGYLPHSGHGQETYDAAIDECLLAYRKLEQRAKSVNKRKNADTTIVKLIGIDANCEFDFSSPDGMAVGDNVSHVSRHSVERQQSLIRLMHFMDVCSLSRFSVITW